MSAGCGQHGTCGKDSWAHASGFVDGATQFDNPRISGTKIADAGYAVAEKLLKDAIDNLIGFGIIRGSRKNKIEMDVTVNQARGDGESGAVTTFAAIRNWHLRAGSYSATSAIVNQKDGLPS